MRVRFDHCVVHVSDWERSNAFYRDVMGAEVVELGERFAYRFGDVQLNLHGPGVDATPVAGIPVPPAAATCASNGSLLRVAAQAGSSTNTGISRRDARSW